jgi:putative alpha-1,2-mannosidase
VGGALPFGVVKLGIDTYDEPVNQSVLNGGWTPNGKVTGISMLHVSGTGGGSVSQSRSQILDSVFFRTQIWVSRSDALGESGGCQFVRQPNILADKGR